MQWAYKLRCNKYKYTNIKQQFTHYQLPKKKPSNLYPRGPIISGGNGDRIAYGALDSPESLPKPPPKGDRKSLSLFNYNNNATAALSISSPTVFSIFWFVFHYFLKPRGEKIERNPEEIQMRNLRNFSPGSSQERENRTAKRENRDF